MLLIYRVLSDLGRACEELVLNGFATFLDSVGVIQI